MQYTVCCMHFIFCVNTIQLTLHCSFYAVHCFMQYTVCILSKLLIFTVQCVCLHYTVQCTFYMLYNVFVGSKFLCVVYNVYVFSTMFVHEV